MDWEKSRTGEVDMAVSPSYGGYDIEHMVARDMVRLDRAGRQTLQLSCFCPGRRHSARLTAAYTELEMNGRFIANSDGVICSSWPLVELLVDYALRRLHSTWVERAPS